VTVCPLSPRQLEAVKLISKDKIAKVVAHEMGTTVNVITGYLQIARLKTDTVTTTGLVAKAIREKWIE
jgi:DNA-binding HTH domain-containing proteins